MIAEADSGCLFRAPEAIKKEYAHIRCVETYEDFLKEIDLFLSSPNEVTS